MERVDENCACDNFNHAKTWTVREVLSINPLIKNSREYNQQQNTYNPTCSVSPNLMMSSMGCRIHFSILTTYFTNDQIPEIHKLSQGPIMKSSTTNAGVSTQVYCYIHFIILSN